MTATYTADFSIFLNDARFDLGDTDTTDPLLQDAEYAAALAKEGTWDKAKVRLARGLIARYARLPDTVSADGVTFSWRERVAVWRELVAAASSAATSGIRIRPLARPQNISPRGEYT